MHTSTHIDYAALYDFDKRQALESGALVVSGIDEAGRGPLAGPVVVAAVILPMDAVRRYNVFDSKQIAPSERQDIADAFKNDPTVRYAMAVRSASQIDEINILQATHQAMREVALALAPDVALVDGCKVPGFPVPARFIVKGDATSACIAAASIMAKTYRDEYMEEMNAIYPGYGFAKHKGYGTAAHIRAIRELGPCKEHRLSFEPIKSMLNPPPTQMELNI